MNFDEKAHIWETISLSQKQAANDLFGLINAKSDDKIIDVGCGSGYLTEKLYTIANNTVGTDISENMIKVAKTLRPHINFYVSNAENLSQQNQYDWIVTNAVTYYFKDIEGTFKKFFNALKFGGSYALQSQVVRTPEFDIAFKKLEQDQATKNIFSTFRLPIVILTLPQFIEKLEKVGFKIKTAKVINYQTEYTIQEALDVFKSGAATQYLNPNAYQLPLTDEYVKSFWRVIEKSFVEQSAGGKLSLGFPRCFIVANK
jgi:trans-aconitate methyltransferase